MLSPEHYGWLLINIAIPLLAPLALLPLVKLSTFFRDRSHGMVRRAVEHGQMLWAALPMSASACYMLIGALEHTESGHSGGLIYLGAHICLIALCATGIVLGAMESCIAAGNARHTSSAILRYSLALTAITAAMHFLAYLYVVQPMSTSFAPSPLP